MDRSQLEVRLKSALGGHIVYGLDERIIYAADYQSDIGGCIDHGLEEIIKHAVEEFSGQSFKKVGHLWLKDGKGELYGIPARVEYDLYLEDTVNYVAEIKSHIKPGDVLIFHRKSLFAEKQLLKRIKPIMISASITKDAKEKCKELGIDLISRSVVD